VEMIKYYCDFCGKELTENEQWKVWVLDAENNGFVRDLGHICADCVEKIEKLKEEKKKEAVS